MSREYVVKAFGVVMWVAVAALVAALAIASPAGATPKGIWSVFRNCPVAEVLSHPANEENGNCFYVQTAGGALTIGRTTVPIDRTITIQAGGLRFVEGGAIGWDLVPPSGGTIMSRTPLEVPGGLSGVLQCGAIGGRLAEASCGAAEGTEVTATIEVVASSSDPAFMSGHAFGCGRTVDAVADSGASEQCLPGEQLLHRIWVAPDHA
jgi:hypothetical protein